ncbi:MAG: hypothetical protein JXB10_07445 [Pirellulales bacterium]|nr:hypothetical protein [Pirellulales bacterium]
MNRLVFTIFIVGVLAASAPRLAAAVAVLENRTDAKVDFRLLSNEHHPQAGTLVPTEVRAVPITGPLGIEFLQGKTTRRYRLEPNAIQCFINTEGYLELRSKKLVLAPGEDRLPLPQPRIIDRTPMKITVKLLADDDQPMVRAVWEKEFRERIAEASKIFEACCGVDLEVVAVDTWVSDNALTDFGRTLREFEQQVDPAPARLAIGFTSQYKKPEGKVHLGGTRGPLYPYILIREWSQHVSKSERLEVLVHELGHFLAATHSVDKNSVMRSRLGDHRSRSAQFLIQFDPLSVLAMNVFVDELRAGSFHGLQRLPMDARRQLQQVYLTAEKEIVVDPASPRYRAMLAVPSFLPPPKTLTFLEGTRQVLQAIRETAEKNRQAEKPLRGDALTDAFVRRAAATAQNYPSAWDTKAFLLGVGIGLSDLPWGSGVAGLEKISRKLETPENRRARLAVLGNPTLRGRRDLVQHFFLSAAICSQLSPEIAEQLGTAKECSDALGKSGFSFADYSADLAGIAFAKKLEQNFLILKNVADSFQGDEFFPAYEHLPEGLSWADFLKDYGSVNDPRFRKRRKELLDKIESLPGYKNAYIF